ncbi:hypothetical protein GGQ97_001768 [Sphingomonas kaistensis]|uniref:PilZ domain-containing protein n=1 Tax=Sphingomonas kaistensis TaxID=298708 RepID=A0A7X6BH02_9SPHN|nr:PilZ domain-containing protein [Sphingomonas kaistensis]NJC05975.1 hypothetical protein [Sphingomonas kaistensis]
MISEKSGVAPEGDFEQRPTRIALGLEASLVIAGEHLTATVLDISHRGVRLRVSEALIVGETVELELGRSGFVMVRISWTNGNEVGGVFLDLE